MRSSQTPTSIGPRCSRSAWRTPSLNLKLVFGFWMDLTLLKFCYQHIVSWLNLVNVLRWSVAFLLCRGGTATNVVFVVTMCFFVFTENASDALLGMNLGRLLGYRDSLQDLAYCTTLYLMSTQRTWRDEEFMPEREVNVFGNTDLLLHRRPSRDAQLGAAAADLLRRRRRLRLPEDGVQAAHLQRAAVQVGPHQNSAAPRRASRVGRCASTTRSS